MSVPEGKRTESRMKVFVEAQELCAYTVQITSNTKTFNPQVDDDIIKRIRNCGYDIYAMAWRANKIRADTSKENRLLRYDLQMDAIGLCDDMLVYIGIAKKVFHLSSKRMKYWAGKILDVQKLLRAWKDSDIRRYGKP